MQKKLSHATTFLSLFLRHASHLGERAGQYISYINLNKNQSDLKIFQ